MLTSIAGDTPVIADMDTGFGSVLNISRTVQMYERAGAAAFHIEDQVMYDYFWFFFQVTDPQRDLSWDFREHGTDTIMIYTGRKDAAISQERKWFRGKNGPLVSKLRPQHGRIGLQRL